MLRTVFDRRLEATELTRAQWQAVVYLFRSNGLTQTELAQQLDVERATIGRVIDKLAAAGFVERRDQIGDRRVKRVFVTDKAISLVPLMAEEASAIYQEIFGEIDRKDLESTITVLNGVRDKLRTIAGKLK